MHIPSRLSLNVFAATAAMFVISMSGSALPGAEFFVAPHGNDANPGTKEQPLATLQRARDAIRELKKAGPLPVGGAMVWVRGGVYELSQTFQLTAEDSGSEAAPVVYRAYADEKPVLSGGRQITGFTPHRGRIVKADVAAQGFNDTYFRQLFFNGQRQPLARYPNFDAANPHGGGFAYVEGDLVSMYKDLPHETRRVLQCKEGDCRHWAKPREGQVLIFPRYNWRSCLVPIASVDREERQITLARDVWWGVSHTIRPGDRYYVRNLFEELDAPGEWYLDQATGTLYFWPPRPIQDATLRAPVIKDLIEIGPNAAWITFRGFTVECCDGNGISIQQSRNCLLAGNVVRNVGGRAGIAIAKGEHCGVVGNDVSETCHQGILVEGGDADTLTPGGHYVDNNYVHHVGALDGHGCGVFLRGIGLRVSHNLIHDTTRCGIYGGGNDCLIEYNHIRHVNLETEDTGGYYNGGAWHVRGQIIRYNYIHDVLGYGRRGDKWISPCGAHGIYLDDDHSGTHVHGNIVARTSNAGIMVHGGRDNVIENNIIIDGASAQVTYSGHDPGAGVVASHLQSLQKYRHNPAYAKYPEIAQMDPDTAWRMVGNRFVRNIICYRNPQARLYRFSRNDFPDQNVFDFNVIFHGEQPLLTGYAKARDPQGPNLLPNADFEQGSPGTMPGNWWKQESSSKGVTAAVTQDVQSQGKQSLQIKTIVKHPETQGSLTILSAGAPARPGETYVLRARIKSQEPGASVFLAVQSNVAGPQNWQGHVPETSLPLETDWTPYELCFRFPDEGDPYYDPGVKTMRVRLRCRLETGGIWVDDMSLQAATAMGPWESWQAMGFDRHSVVADPRFVNPEQDDYRLQPDSPALPLGFEQIPVETIGPYQDELRATWPIVEAEGVREHPLPAEQGPLWPAQSPLGDGTYEAANASITAHLPMRARATGAAIVICPGGGYMRHVLDREGPRIARWLNEHGIAGIVLEYRLPQGRPLVPLLDAQRAIRTVRSKAAQWNLDPNRIGILGFSAGGHLASTAGTHFERDALDSPPSLLPIPFGDVGPNDGQPLPGLCILGSCPTSVDMDLLEPHVFKPHILTRL